MVIKVQTGSRSGDQREIGNEGTFRVRIRQTRAYMDVKEDASSVIL